METEVGGCTTLHDDTIEDDASQMADHLSEKEYIESLSSVTACKVKIQQFKAAVDERDGFISQLQTKLQECVLQRDELAKDAEAQSTQFKRDVDLLQEQLKESRNLLEKQNRSGVNMIEHIELKNKLISLQQNRSSEKEELIKLKAENDALREMETKYKYLLKMLKDVKEKHLVEMRQKETELTELQEEELRRREKEYQQQIERIEEEEGEKREREMKQWKDVVEEMKKDYQLQLQEMTEEQDRMKEELQEAKKNTEQLSTANTDLTRDWEHRVETLRKELSEKHKNDLENLQKKHEGDVALIAEQIELMERNQKEDQAKVLANLEELNREALRYKDLLEQEQSMCKDLTTQLNQSEQLVAALNTDLNSLKQEHNMFINKTKDAEQLKSRVSELEAEVTRLTEDGRVRVKELTKIIEIAENEKAMKIEALTELESEVTRLREDGRVKTEELSKTLETVENEKAMKNEANLKLQELSGRCENLGTRLKEKENELEEAVLGHNSLREELNDVKLKLELVEDENRTLANSEKETSTSKCELEQQLDLLKQEVVALTSSVVNLEQYKIECHSLKERITNFVRALKERENILSNEEVMRDANEDVSDDFSLLEAHISYISSKLDESQFLLNAQSDSILVQNSLREDGSHDSLKSAGLEHNNLKISVGCQTTPVLTQEQGFQTTSSEHSSPEVFSSKTIEEDYIMEEIYVVPKRFALKGSVSLKNLQEIGVTSSNYLASSSTSALLPQERPSTPTQSDYNHLKTKLHDAQFVIRSLENEIFHLKKALQFKKSVTGVCSTMEANGHPISKPNSDSEVTHTPERKNESCQTDYLDEASVIRSNLMKTLADNVFLLEQEDEYLKTISFLQEEISRLEKSSKLSAQENITESQDISQPHRINSPHGTSVSPCKKTKKATQTTRTTTQAPRKEKPSQANTKTSHPNKAKCSNDNLTSGAAVPSSVPDPHETMELLKSGTIDPDNLETTELPKSGTSDPDPVGTMELPESGTSDPSREEMEEGNMKVNPQWRDSCQKLWQTKLEIQMLISEALRQQLEENFLPESKSGDEPEGAIQSLQSALNLFIQRRCPHFRRRESWVTRLTDDWNRLIDRQSNSVDERERIEERKSSLHEREEEEKEGRESHALFSSLLEELKDTVRHQQETKKQIKELENNLISRLESNLYLLKELPHESSSELLDLGSVGSLGAIHSLDFGTSDLMMMPETESETGLLSEFEDMTSAIVEQAQNEKIELLQNQRIMMMKILQENQARISTICRRHLDKLKDTSILGSDMDSTSPSPSPSNPAEAELWRVSEEIESSLSEEVAWMEKEYEELVKQYSHEQSLHTHSHSLTLREFRQRIASLIQRNKHQPSLNNMELWKPLLSLLSQVTLNLLHYYTVSQKFANHEDDSELMPDAFSSMTLLQGTNGHHRDSSGTPEEGSEGDNSLRISLPDDGLNPMDTTVHSEGILDDLDRSEQVKGMLTASYPYLMKALKGSYDQVSLSSLEGEAQELIISLQAAAGMLRVFMLSKGQVGRSVPSRTVTGESGVATASSSDPHLEQEHPLLQNIPQGYGGPHSPLLPQGYGEPHSPPTSCGISPPSDSGWNPDGGQSSSTSPPDLREESGLSPGLASSSALDYTLLKPLRAAEDPAEGLQGLQGKLEEARTEREQLLTKLHQVQGLYAGQVDEKTALAAEMLKREDTLACVVKELQETRGRLVEAESRLKEIDLGALKTNKKQHDRDIKDRVKAVLAAKDRQAMDEVELGDRVRDLENVLEEVVQERDKSLEGMNMKVVDLTQQLEVADRQLRSSRQFLEEQATERDLEVEELVRANEKLKEQLKERESLVLQHAGLQKEVRILERELREKYAALGEERAQREGTESDLAAALDKVKDLREDVQSLESQLAAKFSELRTLQEENYTLTQSLEDAGKHNVLLQAQLDKAQNQFTTSEPPQSLPTLVRTPFDAETWADPCVGAKFPLERQISLSEELENTREGLEDELEGGRESRRLMNHVPDGELNLSQDPPLVEKLIHRLERSTQGLESLQLTLLTEATMSDEEISVRERLEMSMEDLPHQEKPRRSLSPASLETKLEEKMAAFERAAEAAAKYTKDLEMRLTNLKAEYDELATERDELHQQLSVLSSLKCELEKASEEFDLLRGDFERNVTSLRQELTETKEREEELKRKVEQMKGEVRFSKEEAERSLAECLKNLKEEEQQLQKDREALEKTCAELTQEREMLRKTCAEQTQEREMLRKTCAEQTQERDMLRKQNSENLIKISGLEARLEESRRSADSAFEGELRMRISTLQEELQRSRAELTARFRETEDLRYTVKDLHQKLVVREEELDRLNEAAAEPVSLPQSIQDLHRHRVLALEEDLQREKTLNRDLQEKLNLASGGPTEESPPGVSNALFESLLDEKNSRIESLLQQKDDLTKAVLTALASLDLDQPSTEIAKMLRTGLNPGLEPWEDRLESGPFLEQSEVQRRAPDYTTDTPDSLLKREKNGLKAPLGDETGLSSILGSSLGQGQPPASSHSSDEATLEPLKPFDEKSSRTRSGQGQPRDSHGTNSTEATLTSENALLRDQILILEQEVRGLTDYQKKLEEDFSAAQEMLDAKEEEIQALTEEVEDCVPGPFRSTGIQFPEERLTEMMREKQEIDRHCRELEAQLLKQEADAERALKVQEEQEEEVKHLKQKVEDLSERNQDVMKERDDLLQKTSSLEFKLEEESGRCLRMRGDLTARNQEVQDLSGQVDRLLTQYKDANTRYEKKVKAIEREHFREMQEMKNKNIDREKQLQTEYEERMNVQVDDLLLKLSREKEEALKAFKDHYETLLAKALQENFKQNKNPDRANRDRHRSSSEDLQRDLQKELKTAATLDQSILCYLEGTATGGSGGSRESSVLSEGAAAAPGQEEASFNALRIQNLMRKVHKEGIQVLSLSEFLFLQGQQGGGGSHPDTRTPSENQEGTQEVMQATNSQNVAEESTPSIDLMSEVELSRIRKKVELLKLNLMQEKGFSQEVQELLQREKKEVDDLRKLLEEERSRQFDLTSELASIKYQSQILEKELHGAHAEVIKLRERLEVSEKQIENLEEALSAERNNFNHVSTTLNHQRKLATTSADHQSQVIKELRNCLEKERTRVLSLVTEVHELKTSRGQPTSLEDSVKVGLESHSSFIEMEIRLAMALDKEREMQREISDLQTSLQAVSQERAYERDQYLKEVREDRLQEDRHRSDVIKLESKNGALLAELEEKTRSIQDLEASLKRHQLELADLRKSKRTTPEGDHVGGPTPYQGGQAVGGVCSLCKDEHNALTMSQLKQKEVEISGLRRKLSLLETEMRLFEEKERAFVRETQRSGTAHELHHLGSHTPPRIKNLSEFLEIQQRENVDLCKTLARLTDDRRLLRQRILMLEGVVDELNLQLASQEKYLVQENLSDKNRYGAERTALAAEVASLKMALAQAEAKKQDAEIKVFDLQKSSEKQLELSSKRELISTQFLRWKLSRCESYRKALVWQKEYLIHLLKGYYTTETKTIGRLTTMARNVLGEAASATPTGATEGRDVNLTPMRRFRSLALVVVAVQRMKILMKKWRLKARLKTIIDASSIRSSSESTTRSASPAAREPHSLPSDFPPGASVSSPSVTPPITVGLEDVLGPHDPVLTPATASARRSFPLNQISGFTPPTKESAAETRRAFARESQVIQSRNLFGSGRDEVDLNQCIERLDYIHSQLGLPKTPS